MSICVCHGSGKPTWIYFQNLIQTYFMKVNDKDKIDYDIT